MTAMPVVWCTDPNSVNNKPTAFALHGIQLQGNVTEKQVTALRELVNAAAEGRLILPSDGTFTLLDSGLSIESSIVEQKSSGLGLSSPSEPSEPIQPKNAKNTYILMPVSKAEVSRQGGGPGSGPGGLTIAAAAAQLEFLLEPAANPDADVDEQRSEDGQGGEILYEFLCCAKCMNEQRNGHNSTCAGRRLRRFLKTSASGKSSDYEPDNDPAATWQLKVDPVSSIASKYARRQQRQKAHGTVSMGIARNRAHRHQKLPMHCVKIFHNRSSYTPATTATLAAAACNVGGGREVSTIPMPSPSPSAIPIPIPSSPLRPSPSSANRVSVGSEAFSFLPTAARSTSLTAPEAENPAATLALYAVVNKYRDLANKSEKTEKVTSTTMLSVVPEEPTLVLGDGRDLISFDDDQVGQVNEEVQAVGQQAGAAVDLLSAPNEENLLLSLPDTPPPTPPKPGSPGSNNSSRKTSFDSTSTLSSMDSGFMEMQNKLDALAAATAAPAGAAAPASPSSPGSASGLQSGRKLRGATTRNV